MTHIVARECGLDVGDLVYSIGDAHIYSNHIEQVKEQLNRTPRDRPSLQIADDFRLSDFLYSEFPLDTINKFELIGYDPHPAIKAPMAV